VTYNVLFKNKNFYKLNTDLLQYYVFYIRFSNLSQFEHSFKSFKGNEKKVLQKILPQNSQLQEFGYKFKEKSILELHNIMLEDFLFLNINLKSK
jgi:hypothetical protein